MRKSLKTWFLGGLPLVFQWRDKLISALALISANLVCFSLMFSQSGLIYLILNFLVFFVVVSVFYVRLIAFVNNIQ